MTVKKAENGKWKVDLWPNGRHGKRVRKEFKTQREALAFEKYVLSEAAEKPWEPQKRDLRTFKELSQIWFDGKGRNLDDGQRRLKALFRLSEWAGNPTGLDITPALFSRYSAYLQDSGRSKKTVNNILGYTNSMFNHLLKTGEIKYQNPLAAFQKIKIDEKELAWLSPNQIEELLKGVSETAENPHISILTKICLATGCRWGEAESLNLDRIKGDKAHFTGTKSGKNRSVPISTDLATEIREHIKQHGDFTSSLSSFRRALMRTSIKLPPGQNAHVLRHTFASHFIMNGGNILALQKILGHSTLNMTMKYAHLAPDHLQEAVNLNPLEYKP